MNKTIMAKRIKHYRRMAHMSQETLAEKAGVSDTYVRKLEAGKNSPSLDVLIALANALGITPNDLLLPATELNKSKSEGSNILELLNDCTSSEQAILYDSMSALKRSLRTYLK